MEDNVTMEDNVITRFKTPDRKQSMYAILGAALVIGGYYAKKGFDRARNPKAKKPLANKK